MRWTLLVIVLTVFLALAHSASASIYWDGGYNIVVRDEGTASNPIRLSEAICQADALNDSWNFTQCSDNRFLINTKRIYLWNTHAFDENISIVFNQTTGVLVYMRDSSLTLGKLVNAQNHIVSNPVIVEHISPNTYVTTFFTRVSESYLRLYDVTLKTNAKGRIANFDAGSLTIEYSTLNKVYADVFQTTDFYRVNILNSNYGMNNFNGVGFEDIHLKNILNDGFLVKIMSGNLSLRNIVARNISGYFVHCVFTPAGSNLFLIDVDSDNWQYYPDPRGDCHGWTRRVYSFNLKLMDVNGNPISGAQVNISNVHGELVVSEVTGADGTIPEQFLTKIRYNQDNLNGVSDEPYRIIISHPDYTLKNFTFTVDSPIDWTIPLEGKEDFMDLASVLFLSFVTLGLIGLSFLVVDLFLKFVIIAFAGLTASGAFMIGASEFQSKLGSVFDAGVVSLVGTTTLLWVLVIVSIYMAGYYFVKHVYKHVKQRWKA